MSIWWVIVPTLVTQVILVTGVLYFAVAMEIHQIKKARRGF